MVTENGQDATAAMLATWMDQRHGAPDPITEMRGLLMVASTNQQVDRLNAGAQAIRAARNELGRGRTYDLPGSRSLHLRTGDYVMIRINQREEGMPDAYNGYRGYISRIHATAASTSAGNAAPLMGSGWWRRRPSPPTTSPRADSPSATPSPSTRAKV
ncbi:hypothetical protein ACFFQW_13040 [Umezawaea endophytica]|uniref:Uncharacterized protein n=1 Tax=Umezawaea endophytica TaxID=1654476 RepID=A0A9X3AGT1_9PSEU|nr:hypothetical protein [Umezawaea endophytica]MCS7478740.1 hypothetical protein [Umezawaea endophytica]